MSESSKFFFQLHSVDNWMLRIATRLLYDFVGPLVEIVAGCRLGRGWGIARGWWALFRITSHVLAVITNPLTLIRSDRRETFHFRYREGHCGLFSKVWHTCLELCDS